VETVELLRGGASPENSCSGGDANGVCENTNVVWKHEMMCPNPN
jgi:hypothetical protein